MKAISYHELSEAQQFQVDNVMDSDSLNVKPFMDEDGSIIFLEPQFQERTTLSPIWFVVDVDVELAEIAEGYRQQSEAAEFDSASNDDQEDPYGSWTGE